MKSEWYIINSNDELPLEKEVFLCYIDKTGVKMFTIGGYYYQDDEHLEPCVVYDMMNDEVIDNVFAYMPFPKEIF